MKLTYRGIAYETSAPLASTASNQPKVKLTYRGLTYYAAPRQVVEPELDGPTVTLYYRGNPYERRVRSVNLSYMPRAINWRHQAAQ